MERRYIERAALEALLPGRLGGAALAGLWVAGSLEGLAAPAVAVVGTRAPSDAGRALARRMACNLARSGVCVVSGLAFGIDAAAHEGALDAGGPTVGVLGGGHGCFYPPRNRELGGRMLMRGGAVVSPFAPELEPRPAQFLARNAVIAALADAVVVVEAAARSGALNTASHAADLGVPVLAVPGDVDRSKAAGCNALIRDGALLVRDAADVLAALPLPLVRSMPKARAAAVRIDDPLEVRRLLGALADGARDAESLAEGLDLPPPALLALIGELEAAGRICCGPDGYALHRA